MCSREPESKQWYILTKLKRADATCAMMASLAVQRSHRYQPLAPDDPACPSHTISVLNLLRVHGMSLLPRRSSGRTTVLLV